MRYKLYKGCNEDKHWLCKMGIHNYNWFNSGFVYIESALDKYPLMSQQIKFMKRHGKEPEDKHYRLLTCKRCSKEKKGKLIKN